MVHIEEILALHVQLSRMLAEEELLSEGGGCGRRGCRGFQ